MPEDGRRPHLVMYQQQPVTKRSGLRGSKDDGPPMLTGDVPRVTRSELLRDLDLLERRSPPD